MSHKDDDVTDDLNPDGRPPSTYEKIMVAAREAKRLSATERDGALLKRKPTTLAIKNVAEDGVDYRFRERNEAAAPLEGAEFEDGGAE
jgi:DNA-directed RNA polymerase subunit K/omega